MHAAPPPAITGGGAAFYKRVLRKGSVPSGYFSARAETDLARATCHAVCKLAAGCCGKGAPIFKSALPAASQEAEGQTPLQGASTGVARPAFSLPSKSACRAAKTKAAQQAFAFCSLRPPQHTRAGTAFPPGGRKQFRLRRYTVRNRRQKTGGFRPLRRQRYWQAKDSAASQSKIPVYDKLDFAKGSAALQKNTRLQQAGFAGAGTVLRKKHPPAAGRLCRSGRSFAKKYPPAADTHCRSSAALLENFRLASGPALPQGRRRRFSCVVAKAAHLLPQSIFAFPSR